MRGSLRRAVTANFPGNFKFSLLIDEEVNWSAINWHEK